MFLVAYLLISALVAVPVAAWMLRDPFCGDSFDMVMAGLFGGLCGLVWPLTTTAFLISRAAKALNTRLYPDGQ